MTPTRKIPIYVRILTSVALMALAFYFVQRQRTSSSRNASATGKLFLAGSPSDAATRFDWIPSYPGAEIEDIQTSRSHDQLAYSFDYHVKDDGAKVRAFYETTLRAAGFTVIGKGGATGNSWDLYGENPDRTRTIDLNGNAQPEGVRVRVKAVVR